MKWYLYEIEWQWRDEMVKRGTISEFQFIFIPTYSSWLNFILTSEMVPLILELIFQFFKKWFLQIFAEGWNCKDKNVYIYYFILKADWPNFILKSNWPKSTFIHYFIQSASRMHLFLLSGSVFQQLKSAANSNSPFSKIK